MISKSSSSPVVLVTLGHIKIILLFCTKRQIKQLFKATEKKLIANGFEWPRGNCHVQRKLQAKSMAGAVHAATVARRDVSIA